MCTTYMGDTYVEDDYLLLKSKRVLGFRRRWVQKYKEYEVFMLQKKGFVGPAE